MLESEAILAKAKQIDALADEVQAAFEAIGYPHVLSIRALRAFTRGVKENVGLFDEQMADEPEADASAAPESPEEA
jgi:hypothetical protein